MSERARAQAETLFLVRRLLRLAVVVAVVLAAGTVAFALVEDISPWRGFVTTLEPAGVVAVSSAPAITSVDT